MKKVKIKSLVSGMIVINNPDLRVKRTWEKKGAIKMMDLSELEQVIYDPAVDYLFRQGMLGIVGDDAHQIMVDLGLEDDVEGAPTIIMLTDDKMKEISQMKMVDFRKAINELSYEQVQEYVNYCIQNELTDYDKVMFLKDKTGVDILSAIRLNREDKEDLEEE